MTNLQKIREACIKSNPEIYSTVHNVCKEKLCTCEEGNKHREFGLADVLLAIEVVDGQMSVYQNGNFYKHGKTLSTWNLKETFENQSKETIDFIAELLKVKE